MADEDGSMPRCGVEINEDAAWYIPHIYMYSGKAWESQVIKILLNTCVYCRTKKVDKLDKRRKKMSGF